MILPYGMNVEVRIQSLTCSNCLLFAGAEECQLIAHNVTIRTFKTTGDVKLDFFVVVVNVLHQIVVKLKSESAGVSVIQTNSMFRLLIHCTPQ